MIEIDLICPNCGGRLEINMNREKSFCPYCDSEFSVYRKLNEKLEKVKELCQKISNIDVQIIASENIKEYRNMKMQRSIWGFRRMRMYFLSVIWLLYMPVKMGLRLRIKVCICGETVWKRVNI